MKHLFTVLLTALLSLPTIAADFELDFLRNKDGTQTIIHNPDDWLLVSSVSGFDLLIDKSLIKEKKSIYLLHSVTILKPARTFNGIDGTIERIYTHGILMCDNAVISLSGEFYTDKNGKIAFYNAFEPGAYLVEVATKNTVRNDVYNLLCKESV